MKSGSIVLGQSMNEVWLNSTWTVFYENKLCKRFLVLMHYHVVNLEPFATLVQEVGSFSQLLFLTGLKRTFISKRVLRAANTLVNN